MLSFDMKRKINTLRDILVGKIPDPKSQVEQITIAMIYKFMDDMDTEFIGEWGGVRKFFLNTDKVKYEKYAWSNIMQSQVSGEERSFLYREGIEAMPNNPNLPQLFRDVFRNAYIPFRDSETINMFLKEIDDFKYDNSEDLGNAFEMLLSIMGSQGDAGQFRTPRNIIDMIVDIIEPHKNEAILDPACGTAGFLISAYKHILNENMDKDGKNTLTADEKTSLTNNLVGYDISQDMVRLSRVNMYLHNFPDPKIYEYDTLTSQDRWEDNFDVILANPPFMTPKGGINPHKRFSVQAKRSEVLFVDYIAEHLSPNGRAGIIVPEGIVFQTANAYKDLRKMLVENNYLYAVISLPAGVFNPYSGVKTSILLFDKALAKKTDKILFLRIDNDGFNLGAQRKEISDNDIPKIVEILRKYKELLIEGKEFEINEYEEEFAVIAKKEEVARRDYILVGESYRVKEVHRDTKYPMVELGKATKIISGYAFNSSDFIDNGGSKVIKITNIGVRNFVEDAIFLPSNFVEKYDKFCACENDIALALTRPYISTGLKVSLVPKSYDRALVNQRTAVIRQIGNISDYKYIYYILQSSFAFEYIVDKSKSLNQPNLSIKDLEILKIPLPPLSIQEKIVEEIESYQRIIDGARQVVENYKPTIKIDHKWEIVELGKVAEVNKATVFPVEVFGENEFIYIDISSVENETGKISYSNLVAGVEAPSRARRKVNNGDILLSTVRPNLKAFGYVDFGKIDKCVASTGFAVLSPTNIDGKYLYYLVFQDFVLNQMISAMGKGAYPSINQNDVIKLSIPLPESEIQKQIAEQISEEQGIVEQNRRLIEIFQQKIKDKVAEVWGE